MDARSRILIVDDNPGLLETLKEFLETQSATGQRYVVETAADGAEGLTAVMQRRPDLVILDVDMPGMNGVEVLKRIRRLDSSIPVIMLTGNANNSVAAQTLKAGASSYAPKPLNLRYLDHLVSSFIGARRSKKNSP